MFRGLRIGRAATLMALLLTLSGCAAGSGSDSGRVRSSSDRITEAELEPLLQYNAYEAVQRLRARWLTTRTGTPPQVHMDGNPQMGGVDFLRSLRVAEVQEMQFLNAADATTRFGTNYISGAILVVTKH